MAEKRTIERLWRDAATAGRTTPAYLVQEGEEWKPLSWAEAAERVENYANGLLSLGVRKGDAFAIIGSNRVEWALFDFALGSIGAIGAAIYANSSPNDAGYILEHSEAIGVLCEDEAQRAKVESVRGAAPRLEHVLTYADLDDLAARGRAHAAEHPNALREAAERVEEDDLFTYIYTSGTTGPPKACMISHRNYYAMVAVVDDLPSFTGPDDVMLLYLPLAHNFGRLMHLSGAYVGYAIAFLADPLQAAAALPAVKPTVFPSVPRVYEKVHTAVVAKFDAETGAKRKLIDWALGVGRRVSALRRAGEPVPRVLALQFKLADKLVYSKVKERLGGRLRLAISGGAPLSAEIAEFFHAIDILLVEGYGLTECTTAASTNTHEAYRFGTVGRPLPGTEVKLAEDGELLIRSETIFQGYYKEPEATAEVLGAGRLAQERRHRRDRRRRLHHDHRPQEGHHRHRGRQERRAAEPRERPQDLEVRLAGDGRRRPAAVHRGADHARPRGAACVGGGTRSPDRPGEPGGVARGARARAGSRRRGQRRPLSLRADQAVRDPPPRLHDGDDELTPTLKLKRRMVAEHFAPELEELYQGETLNQAAGI